MDLSLFILARSIATEINHYWITKWIADGASSSEKTDLSGPILT